MTQTDVDTDARAVKMVTQVRSFVDWVGTGRKLTPAGRVTLADARELVSLLDTSDVIDPVVYGEAHRTRSSQQLPEVSAGVALAKATGLVRVQHGRLVPVKKNASLLVRPSQLWATMFDAIDQLGDAVGHRIVDNAVLVLDGMAEDGAIAFADASELVWSSTIARYRLDRFTEDHLGLWHETAERDLQRAIDLLVGFGAVTEDETRTVRLTPLAEWATRRRYGPEQPGDPVAQVKVALLRTDPPIWRRIMVPARLRLDRLHRVIQAAMGWKDSHLHVFTSGSTSYGVPDAGSDDSDERRTTLSALVRREGDTIGYEYDFGDGWDHEILLEKIIPAEPGGRYPICVAGESACPPEDCGGPGGYEELIEILFDRSHREHRHMLEWLGLTKASDFDPARFDLAEVNSRLDMIVRTREPTVQR
jgi:hypothetical protein